MSLAVILAATATATTALILTSRGGTPEPLPEPEYICRMEMARPVAPPACDRTTGFPSGAVPVDVSTAPPMAITTASGLQYVVLCRGEGTETPSGDAKVTARFGGWNAQGEDIVPGVRTMDVGLRQVVPGFAEMLQLMHAGDRVRVWIPPRLAYEHRGVNERKIAGTLTFEIEMISLSR